MDLAELVLGLSIEGDHERGLQGQGGRDGCAWLQAPQQGSQNQTPAQVGRQRQGCQPCT